MSATALYTLALLSLLLLKVGAEYQLEAYLSSYSNPTHQQAEAQCCDAGCNNDCDNLFLFCLREAGHSQDDESCPLGMMSTRDTLTDQEVFELGDGLDRRVTNPLAFTGESAWPGTFQLYVRVQDDDRGNNQELVDMVFITENLQVSRNFTSPRSYSGVHNNSRIEFSFRVMCLENYYGPNCTVRCVPRNDSEGHFTCNSAGEIVCDSGYTNVSANCTACVPAEGCMPNQGFCTSPGECSCLEGFTGSLCETDLDPCGSRTMLCQNGGNCSNAGDGGYTCSCSVGFDGQNCEVTLAVGDCTSAPCQNGGTCTSAGQNHFQCQCLPGFQGLLCESNRPEDNDTGSSSTDNSAGLVGGAVAGTLLGVLLTVAGVTVAIVLWKISSKRGSYGMDHTAKTDAQDVTHTIQNPIYDSVEIGLADPPNLNNSYTHSSQTNLPGTPSTEYLLANPLYKQPPEDLSPPPSYAVTIQPYGEYGDNTLKRVASQNTLNEDSADFAVPSFDDDQYGCVQLPPA